MRYLNKRAGLVEGQLFLCMLFWGYRTKRVGFIGDGASKLLAPSLF